MYVCMYVCMFPDWDSYDFLVKILHQTLQLNSFYPVCILARCFKFTTSYNSCSSFFADKLFSYSIFLHMTLTLIFSWTYSPYSLQSNGFLPICFCICIFRSHPQKKSFPTLPSNQGFCLRLPLFYKSCSTFLADIWFSYSMFCCI